MRTSRNGKLPEQSVVMEVSDQDIWIMLLSTVRYAMGRKSYMPALTISLFHKYRSALTKNQQDQLVREVAIEVQLHENLGRTLGDSVHHRKWSNFVDQYQKNCFAGVDNG